MKKNKKKGWLYGFGKNLLRPFFWMIYRMKVVGRENVPTSGRLIFCSNHVSMKDPVFLGISQKRSVFYMAKEELFQKKFFNGLFRALGAFPVSRGSGGGDALQEAYDLLEEERTVGVFIEGHRSKTGELLKPKTGAALLAYRTGATIVPVCITGGKNCLPAPFCKTVVSFGKPILVEELHFEDDSSTQMRRASRKIMEEIKMLRRQSYALAGLQPPREETEGKPL